MNRTTLWLCGAALVATSILAGSARGAVPPADVSNHAIRCGTVVATAQFRPALSFAATATAVTVKIKGKLSGCVDLTNPGLVIDSGTFQGTLVGTTNDCLALTTNQPFTGSLSYRWQANKETPITPTSSIQTVNDMTGGSFAPAPVDQAFTGVSYFSFTLGTDAVTGAFTGGDAGATTTNIAVTSENSSFFTTSCALPGGIKTLHIGIGTITLQ